MSNKTQLQTNNASLDALITRVNTAKDTAASLPDAGSGDGSIETCTVTVRAYVNNNNIHFIYADENGKCVDSQYEIGYDGDLIVNKGIFVITGYFDEAAINYMQTTGGIELTQRVTGTGNRTACLVFNVTDDGSIQLT